MKNLAVVRQTFAQTVFTHKVQEIAVELKEKKAKRFKYLHLIFVSSVLILLGLQAANLDSAIFSYLGIGISVAEIILLIVQLSFNFEREAAQHKSTALKYLGLRDKYLLLIVDIMAGTLQKNELKVRRDALQQEYQGICDLAPQTGNDEYQVAQNRLNKRGVVEGEQFTWSEAEIDRFLPKDLRLSK